MDSSLAVNKTSMEVIFTTATRCQFTDDITTKKE